jgi:acyl-CoA synthetase (AMP-forming)/AMP-acid ligase II
VTELKAYAGEYHSDELDVSYTVVLLPEGSLQRLEQFCRAEMPRYMQPSKIHVHASLPRTSTGKFDLRAAEAAVKVTTT